MTNKEKVEFFQEWLIEIDDKMKDIKGEISELSLPNNMELWKLNQKGKIYSSDRTLRECFSYEVSRIDGEIENIEGEIFSKNFDLNMYNTIKTKVEEEMARYIDEI